MTHVSIIGIDPGLVHTGVVVASFDEEMRQILIEYAVIEGDNHPKTTAETLEAVGYRENLNTYAFIETYRERGTAYSTNPQMRKLVQDFADQFPKAVLVDNTGSKQVVKPHLLRLLGLEKFPATHHQDLQAAARILVYGALKDSLLNQLLSQVVRDHLDGQTWTVIH